MKFGIRYWGCCLVAFALESIGNALGSAAFGNGFGVQELPAVHFQQVFPFGKEISQCTDVPVGEKEGIRTNGTFNKATMKYETEEATFIYGVVVQDEREFAYYKISESDERMLLLEVSTVLPKSTHRVNILFIGVMARGENVVYTALPARGLADHLLEMDADKREGYIARLNGEYESVVVKAGSDKASKIPRVAVSADIGDLSLAIPEMTRFSFLPENKAFSARVCK